MLETETGRYSDTLRSALVSLDGDNAWALSESWCGTIQWICPSPYRSHHGRKNWFLGANKRLARLLIAWKLEQQQQENSAALKSQRRMFHHQIERGNPRRTFTGMAFIEG
ncbi:probable peptide chain release factor [Escherichia coli]|nr:probable peptide chain release factor [Escherichia coli]